MTAQDRQNAATLASSGINPSAPQGYAYYIQLAAAHQRGVNAVGRTRLPPAVGADTPERTVRF